MKTTRSEFASIFFSISVLLTIINGQQVTQRYGKIAGEWKVDFDKQKTLNLKLNSAQQVKLTIFDVDITTNDVDFYFELQSNNPDIIMDSSQVHKSEFILDKNETGSLAHWEGNLPVVAEIIGATQLYCVLKTDQGDLEIYDKAYLNVQVENPLSVHELIFELMAGAIILFMFANLGTVLDLKRLKHIILFPIGPLAAFTSRYVVMPAIGLGLGLALFPNSKNLQLAVFFSTLSPSGGLANICNFFLKGNIDLSIAATTLNSLMTMAMFPLWIVVLGKIVYKNAGLVVPYVNLAISFAGIFLALVFGIMMRLCFPKTTVHLMRFLKPLSVVLSLLLVSVTVGVHIMSFRYVTPMIGVAAIILPLVSYLLTYGLAKLLCMINNDAMTISMEIGVMNMTVPILLLNSSLDSGQATSVLVLPILCALMSILYVVIFFFARRWMNRETNYEVNSFSSKSKLDIAE